MHLQTKSNFNLLGLIIYISASRIVTDLVGSFKSTLLELFIRNLGLNFPFSIFLLCYVSHHTDIINF